MRIFRTRITTEHWKYFFYILNKKFAVRILGELWLQKISKQSVIQHVSFVSFWPNLFFKIFVEMDQIHLSLTKRGHEIFKCSKVKIFKPNNFWFKTWNSHFFNIILRYFKIIIFWTWMIFMFFVNFFDENYFLRLFL